MAVLDRAVLVVDDTPDSRIMLKRMLQTQGYRVVEAADGQEAVEIVKQRCPDLILMDLNMPTLDGLAATEKMRELNGKCAQVPIVAMTAFDIYGMKEAAIEAGCNEYITHPLDLDYLGRVVQQYLGYAV